MVVPVGVIVFAGLIFIAMLVVIIRLRSRVSILRQMLTEIEGAEDENEHYDETGDGMS